ncbi:U1 small nuclear ribonucleoprotein C-like isoform X3 [Mauremys reevesii]|uniref:U1 small nuclear ribonucleoprotein C-like isoform X3 n=1 Tax=Mauremys reevesii TaxID=260615 RepID=UPI001940050C|nr:U1 small nuclear ribonucleoprotein C-like isoform X3 [Mauremys reevesii]
MMNAFFIFKMEEDTETPMDQTDSPTESGDMIETKSKGPRGQGRGRGGRDFGNKGQLSYVRGKMRGKTLNGIGPMRHGIGRMHPYPDPRGRRGGRGGPPFLPPPPMRGMMRDSFSFLPPRHGLPPPPPGPMSFRGRPPHPRARGMLQMPRGRFPPPRGSLVQVGFLT